MGVRLADELERATVAGRRTDVVAGRPWSSSWVGERTDATYRQLDYWVRKGLLGRDLRGVGSGSQRRFTAPDVEVVHALVHLAALGCTGRWLEEAAACVRVMRVGPVGERLVVPLHGPCYRHPTDQSIRHPGPAWIVTLTACPDDVDEAEAS